MQPAAGARGPARPPRPPAGSRRSRCWPASGRRARAAAGGEARRQPVEVGHALAVHRPDFDRPGRTPRRRSRTASCSVAPTIRMRSAPAAMALSIARALASVPPLMKVTASGPAPTRRGDLGPGAFDDGARRAAGGVDRRGIAAELQGARHGRRRLGPHRGGGVVVEIDRAAHAAGSGWRRSRAGEHVGQGDAGQIVAGSGGRSLPTGRGSGSARRPSCSRRRAPAQRVARSGSSTATTTSATVRLAGGPRQPIAAAGAAHAIAPGLAGAGARTAVRDRPARSAGARRCRPGSSRARVGASGQVGHRHHGVASLGARAA